MDYNSLTAQIGFWAKRTDAAFTAQIPNFIELAITDIYRNTQNLGFEIIVNGNLVIGTNTYAKPANWRRTVSFAITDNRAVPLLPPTSFLKERSIEFCKSYSPNPELQAPPQFYSDVGYTNFYIAPNPDYAYPFQLIYLGLPLFNPENPTNFLTLRYPDLLFFGSMAQAMPFLKDDERVPVWGSMYKNALQSVNAEANQRLQDRISKRDVD